jgi:hypothetical protein
MRFSMRRPAVGIAFLLGPAFAFAFASALPACGAITAETADAGTDVYVPPEGCDTIGYTCAQCQACPGTQATCGAQLQACAADDGCTILSACVDYCDENATEVELQECINTNCCNLAEQNALLEYHLAAECVFQTACAQTCTLQAAFNDCQTGGL